MYLNRGDDWLNTSEVVSGFILELRRGILTLCVLSKLNEPTYGYNLVEKLLRNGVSVEANTLYPMLRRMESKGLIQSTWNTEGAKPRKYYRTTEEGRNTLELLKRHWYSTVQSINVVLEEDSDNGK